MPFDCWHIVDRRTGRQATVAVHSRRLGNLQILEWRERQRRGGRPDVSFEAVQALTLVPHAQRPVWP